MHPLLEPIAQSLNYADLPETWRVPEIGDFSAEKTLYDYQTDALQKAARALFLYYGKEHDWVSGETPEANLKRKESFAGRYNEFPVPDLKKYESPADRKNGSQNQVFKILSDYISPRGDIIPYHNLINRMCFWMATGSGKTLVMVKLIEYLHSLKRHGEIPPHNILILAPSDHLLGQIRRTVEEFNRSGLHIDLVPLRDIHRSRQIRLGDTAAVYYHRSDNISDIQKDALTYYRNYENGGKWHVILDEAHKGGKEDSKRQAYYAVMAREGFLFNFSATFTDAEDIATTVKKYNLEEFIKNGHGKKIVLNEKEYEAFKKRKEEINPDERRKIVLKSLITLAYVSLRVSDLRKNTGLADLYHNPLMLTLVNTAQVEAVENDLLAFFQTLREIAAGDIDGDIFKNSKNELIGDWRNARFLFGEDGGGIIGTADETSIKKMTTADLREAVFLSRRKGALQFIRSGDKKELAFQMRNADSPFALIRIGDTSRWRNEFLAGYEETSAFAEKSFFDGLEKSPITILMGSRSFFESWDSNRPNVVNFINIGGRDAKKFVAQSVGRGVRIEPLPGRRSRFSFLQADLKGKEKAAMEKMEQTVRPPETLFLFATNRDALKTVLDGLENERDKSSFEKLEGFEKAPTPKIGKRNMPLLIPEYKEAPKDSASPFAMSGETLERLKKWLQKTSDSVLAVRDGLGISEISSLRGIVADGIQVMPEKNYAMIPFLQNRLLSHICKTGKAPDGVREIRDEDIVHFREIRVHSEHAGEIREKINRVKSGGISTRQKKKLALQYAKGEITEEEFDRKKSGTDKESFKDLTIKKLLRHYYLPVILGDERSHYIRHIIKVPSEIEFLNKLEEWTRKNEDKIPWDAWMFSKIDESLDGIHIPYYDKDKNEYRRFLPDFVFWMCKGDEYRIVFVDPKGDAHASSYRKIDGYKKLFTADGGVRIFNHNKRKVSVNLFLYNPQADPLEGYGDFWIREPSPIFQGISY